ncbi:unnamed protein product [Linum trigynum]|uniref:Uncharacterized protein n=1 Tax=Linum trigynum TaxID=586398 RepID=A0AAV2DVP6_9ROSI
MNGSLFSIRVGRVSAEPKAFKASWAVGSICVAATGSRTSLYWLAARSWKTVMSGRVCYANRTGEADRELELPLPTLSTRGSSNHGGFFLSASMRGSIRTTLAGLGLASVPAFFLLPPPVPRAGAGRSSTLIIDATVL